MLTGVWSSLVSLAPGASKCQSQYSDPCNRFNCLGHFDDDDESVAPSGEWNGINARGDKTEYNSAVA